MHWRQLTIHAAVWGPVLAVAGCSRQETEDNTAIGRVQSAIVAAPSFVGPAGEAMDSVLVSGTRRVHLYDRVELGAAGASVAVLGAGRWGRSDINAGATVHGSVWIGGNAFLGSQARIAGDLRVGRALEQQAGSTVEGATIVPASFSTSSHSWPISTPAPTGDIKLSPDTEATEAPGSYGVVDLQSRAKLRLSSGSYYFASMNLEPESRLEFAPGDEPIVIYVTGEFRAFRGQITGEDLEGRLLLVHLGTSTVELQGPFRGTVIAPNAIVDLRRPEGVHRGAFFGQQVQVQSDAHLELEPFMELECITGCSDHGSCVAGAGSTALECECEGDWVGEHCELYSPILPAEPVSDWELPTDSDSPYVDATPAADGTVLATTDTSVVSVVSDGTTSVLATFGDEADARLDELGEGFVVQSPTQVSLFDAGGANVVTAPTGPFDIIRVFPGGNELYRAEVAGDAEHRWVSAVQVLAAGSTVTLDAPGVLISRLSSDAIHYTDGARTVVLDQSGNELVRTEVPLRHLEVSLSGEKMITELARRGTHIVHFDHEAMSEPQEFPEPVWNLAISPDGVFSVATWQTGVRLFVNGELHGTYSLPLKLAASVAVSDRGEILVGGKTDTGTTRTVLLSRDGTERWRHDGEAELNAYRPDVSFFPGGDAFVVRSTAGLQAYTIDRSN